MAAVAGSTMKRSIILAAKLLLAAALIAYLVGSGKLDLGRIGERLGQIRAWGWIAGAQALILGMLLLTFWRWYLLLRAQGIRYSLRETCVLGFIGYFFSQFVPGSTGGDLIKAYYVAVEHPERRAQGVTTVILDRVVGLLVLVALCACGLVWRSDAVRADPDLLWLARLVLAGLAAALVSSLLFFNDRVRALPIVRRVAAWIPFRGPLDRVQAAIYAYKHRPGIVALSVAISAVVHSLLVLSVYCYARALGDVALPFGSFLFLVPLAHLAMALPVSPGGLGVAEWAFIELFRRAGSADGAVLAVLQRLTWYVWALVGLGFYLARKKTVRRALDAIEADEGAAGAAAPAGAARAGAPPGGER